MPSSRAILIDLDRKGLSYYVPHSKVSNVSHGLKASHAPASATPHESVDVKTAVSTPPTVEPAAVDAKETVPEAFARGRFGKKKKEATAESAPTVSTDSEADASEQTPAVSLSNEPQLA